MLSRAVLLVAPVLVQEMRVKPGCRHGQNRAGTWHLLLGCFGSFVFLTPHVGLVAIMPSLNT